MLQTVLTEVYRIHTKPKKQKSNINKSKHRTGSGVNIQHVFHEILHTCQRWAPKVALNFLVANKKKKTLPATQFTAYKGKKPSSHLREMQLFLKPDQKGVSSEGHRVTQ